MVTPDARRAIRPVTRIVSDRDLLLAVREEIRLAGLTSEPVAALPPPSDTQAEREVCSALLCGQIRPVELGDLEAHHFHLGLHAWVFRTVANIHAAGLTLRPELVIVAALDDGIAADGLGPELEALHVQAWRTLETLRQHAATIVELWRRRELCKLLRAVDLQLRAGAVTHEQAAARLAEGIRA